MPSYTFSTHERFLHLCEIVGDLQAAGAMYYLEAWVCQQHQDGDLSGIRPQTIERVSHWDGEPGEWVAALKETGLLSDQQQLKGWPENAPEFVKKRMRAQESAERRSTAQDGAEKRSDAQPRAEKRPELEREASSSRSKRETRNTRSASPQIDPNTPAPDTPDPQRPVDLPVSRSEQRELVDLMREAWRTDEDVGAALRRLASSQPRLAISEILGLVGIEKHDTLRDWLPKHLTESVQRGGDRANDLKHFLQGVLELNGMNGRAKKPAAMLTKILRERGLKI